MTSRPPHARLASQTQRRQTAVSACCRAKVTTLQVCAPYPPMLLGAFSHPWLKLGPKPLAHSEGSVQMHSIGSDHGTRNRPSYVVTGKRIVTGANFLTETRSRCPYSHLHPYLHLHPADLSNVSSTIFESPYSLRYVAGNLSGSPSSQSSQMSPNSAATRNMSLQPVNSPDHSSEPLDPSVSIHLFWCLCINVINICSLQQFTN